MRSNCLEKGSSSAVVKMLNTLWQKAMPTALMGWSMMEKWKMASPP